MAKSAIREAERRAQAQRQAIQSSLERVARFAKIGVAGRQFENDFNAIAHAIVDPDWHKPPRPHGSAALAPFRTHALPRRLPFGALRRMAKLLGVPALRYVFALGSDSGIHFYRLELRPRLDREFKRGNRYKRHEKQAQLIKFGNAVLELESLGGVTRAEALEAAAIEVGIPVASRSHERYFRQFRSLCAKLGFVPSSPDLTGFPPRFAIADLDARHPDKSQK